MHPLSRDDLMSHRPRLIARSDQRRQAEGFSPRTYLDAAVLADDTLALAERLLGGIVEPPPGGLTTWLDARLELLATERWNMAVRDYTDMMMARARACLRPFHLPESELSPEECVNNAWCNARKYPFQGTTESMYCSWLLRLTATAVTDAARCVLAGKRNPNDKVSWTGTGPGTPDPFDRAIKILYQSTPSAKVRREEFMIQLLAVVERMPEPDRTVAVCTLNGQGANEIASELELTVQRVQAILTRILARVQAILHAHRGDE